MFTDDMLANKFRYPLCKLGLLICVVTVIIFIYMENRPSDSITNDDYRLIRPTPNTMSNSTVRFRTG